MAECPPLVRQWIVLRLLCGRQYGMTIRELADELAVSVKTVRRDLETFIEAGFPLIEDVQEHGRKAWRLDASRNQPGLSFNHDEALALYLGRRFLEPLAGTPFWEALQEAFRKIRGLLGTTAVRYVDTLGRLIHKTSTGASDYGKKADIIDALMVGIKESKAVFVTYQSLQATEPVTYDVYPYGLVYHRGSLYLVGRSPERDQIRHWKLDRMTEAEVTKVPFPRPKDFDVQQHLSGSFGIFHGDGEVLVKVRFAPAVARYVQESIWHPSQQLCRERDGSLLAEFQLSTTEEIKRWIMSFGRHAEVLEPAELRSEILEEVRALLALMEPRANQPRPAAEKPGVNARRIVPRANKPNR